MTRTHSAPLAALRSRFALTSALGASLVVIASPAAAQTTTTGGQGSFGTVGSTGNSGELGATNPTFTITPQAGTTGERLDVNLNARNTVVNWADFKVAAATPTKTVSFNDARALPGGQMAVLNRITGATATEIRGLVTTGTGNAALPGILGTINPNANNITVWVVNGNGIMVGPGASFSTGGLVLSALGMTAAQADVFRTTAAGAAYNVDLVNATNSTSAIRSVDASGNPSLTGTPTQINTGSGVLALIAPAITLNANINTTASGGNGVGTGPTVFAIASDVTLTTSPGGPLAVTLNAGTQVTGSELRGAIVGDRVYALISPDAATNALLNTSAATVTNASVDARGVVVLAGENLTASVARPGGAANSDVLTTGNTASTGLGSARVGAVNFTTAYGGPPAVAPAAGDGLVTLVATDALDATAVSANGAMALTGGIGGVGFTTLGGSGNKTVTSAAAIDGTNIVGSGSVTLSATGDIGITGGLGSNTVARLGTLTINGSAGTDVTIGTAGATGTTAFLTGVAIGQTAGQVPATLLINGASDHAGNWAATLGGAATLGNVTSNAGTFNLTTGGTALAKVGTLSGAASRVITSGGSIEVAAIRNVGAVTLNGAVNGTNTVTVAGGIGDATNAVGSLVINGGNADLGPLFVAGVAQLGGVTGLNSLKVTGATAAQTLTVSTAANQEYTGTVSTTRQSVLTSNAGLVTAATLIAGTDAAQPAANRLLQVTGRSLNIGSAQAGGDVLLTANGTVSGLRNLTLGGAIAGGGVALTANAAGAIIVNGSVTANGGGFGATGAGSVQLTAGTYAATGAISLQPVGPLSIAAGVSVTSDTDNSGDLLIAGGLGTTALNLTGSTLRAGGNGNGEVRFGTNAATATFKIGNVVAGTLSENIAGTVTPGINRAVGTIAGTTFGDLTLSGVNTITTADTLTTGSLTIGNGAPALTLAGGSTIDVTGAITNITGTTGGLTATAPTRITIGTSNLAGQLSLTTNAATATATAGVNYTSLAASGAKVLRDTNLGHVNGGAITGTGAVTLGAAGGPITLTGDIGTLAVKAATITVERGTTVQLQGLNATGATALGSLARLGATTIAGAGDVGSFTSTSGNIQTQGLTARTGGIAVDAAGTATVLGPLTTTTAGANIGVLATGAATIGAGVSSASGYSVTGSTVTLGDAGGAAVTQTAVGQTAIVATGGAGPGGQITGRTGLTLVSNSANAAAVPLLIGGANTGGIVFAAGSTLRANGDGMGEIRFTSLNSTDLFRLGNVFAGTLTQVVGGTAAAQVDRVGAITTGDLTLTAANFIGSDGLITTGAITVGNGTVTLGGDGGVAVTGAVGNIGPAIGGVTINGYVGASAAGVTATPVANFVPGAGAAGAVTIGNSNLAGELVLNAGTGGVTFGTIDGIGAKTLTSGGNIGNPTAGAANVRGTGALLVNGAATSLIGIDTIGTGAVRVSSAAFNGGQAIRLGQTGSTADNVYLSGLLTTGTPNVPGALTINGTTRAGGVTVLTSGNITTGAILADQTISSGVAGSISLRSVAGNIATGALSTIGATTDIVVEASNGNAGTGNLNAVRNVGVTAGGTAQVLGDTSTGSSAGATFAVTAATVAPGTARVNGNVTATGPYTVAAGTAAVDGNVELGGNALQRSAAAVTITSQGGTIAGGTGLTLQSGTGDVTLGGARTTGLALGGTTIGAGGLTETTAVRNVLLRTGNQADPFVLGTVLANQLNGQVGLAIATPGLIERTGAITIGNLVLGTAGAANTIRTFGGPLTVGTGTAGTNAVTTGGALTLGAVLAGPPEAGTTVTTVNGTIGNLGASTAPVTVNGIRVDIDDVALAGTLTINAGSGGAVTGRLNGGTTGGAVAISAGPAGNITTGAIGNTVAVTSLTVSGGNLVTIGETGVTSQVTGATLVGQAPGAATAQLTVLGTLNSGSVTSTTTGSTTLNTVNSAGAVSFTTTGTGGTPPSTGDILFTALNGAGTKALSAFRNIGANTAVAATNAIGSGAAVTLTAGNTVRVTQIGADGGAGVASLLASGTNGVTLGGAAGLNVQTVGAATVNAAAGDVRLIGRTSTGTDLTVSAAGNAGIDLADAGRLDPTGAIGVTAGSIDFGGLYAPRLIDLVSASYIDGGQLDGGAMRLRGGTAAPITVDRIGPTTAVGSLTVNGGSLVTLGEAGGTIRVAGATRIGQPGDGAASGGLNILADVVSNGFVSTTTRAAGTTGATTLRSIQSGQPVSITTTGLLGGAAAGDLQVRFVDLTGAGTRTIASAAGIAGRSIDGAGAVSLSAAQTGDVTLTGTVGAGTAVASLTIEGGAAVTLGTAGGPATVINSTGAVQIGQSVRAGSLLINGDVTAASFASRTGGATALRNVGTGAGAITVVTEDAGATPTVSFGTLTADGIKTVTSAGAITGGSVLGTGAVALTGGTGSPVTITGTIGTPAAQAASLSINGGGPVTLGSAPGTTVVAVAGDVLVGQAPGAATASLTVNGNVVNGGAFRATTINGTTLGDVTSGGAIAIVTGAGTPTSGGISAGAIRTPGAVALSAAAANPITIGSIGATGAAVAALTIDGGSLVTLGATGSTATNVVVTGATSIGQSVASGTLVVNGPLRTGSLLSTTSGSTTLGQVIADAAVQVAATAGNIAVGAVGGPGAAAAGAITVSAGGSVGSGVLTSNVTVAVTAGTTATVAGGSSGGDFGVAAGTGAATIAGAVTADGAYRVRGAGVALGGTGVTQAARGLVDVTSTGSALTLANGTTLQANSDGTGAEYLALDASGPIVAGGATLLGGTAGQRSDVSVLTRTAGQTVTLGSVTARALNGVDAARTTFGALTNAGDITVTGPVTVQQLLALTSTGGAITLNTADVTGAGQGATLITAASGGTNVTAQRLTTQGPVTIDARGTVTVANTSGTGGSIRGTTVDLPLIAVGGGALSVTSTAGQLRIGTGTAGATTLNATGPLEVTTSLTTSGATNITATGAAALRQVRVSAGALSVTAGGAVSGGGTNRADLATTGAGGNVTVQAGTSALLGPIGATSGAVTLSAGTTLDASTINAGQGVTVTSGGTTQLGATTAGGAVAVTATAINAGATAANGGALTLTATGGAIMLASGSAAGNATIDTTATATLGQVIAGAASTLTIRALDAALNGTQRAGTVAIVNRAPATQALKLGTGVSTGGFILDATEVNNIEAGQLTLDGGAGNVEIGTMAFDADAGRARIDVLSTGRVDVLGGVGATSTASRALRLGGTAAGANDKAAIVRVVATDTAGGRIVLDGVDLELRGARIGVGQAPGFLTPIGFGPGQTPLSATTVGAEYVGNPNSSLYNSTLGGLPYSNPTVIQARSLTVRFTDYALFQNTGTPGNNSGVVLGSAATPSIPALVVQGPGGNTVNAFAIFATINGVSDTSASVAGSNFVQITGVDGANARVNGCVAGSGAGCLTSTINQPILSVFDNSRINIFRTADDLALPFDPVIGTNNEALFSGFGVGDSPSGTECTPENTSPECGQKREQGK